MKRRDVRELLAQDSRVVRTGMGYRRAARWLYAECAGPQAAASLFDALWRQGYQQMVRHGEQYLWVVPMDALPLPVVEPRLPADLPQQRLRAARRRRQRLAAKLERRPYDARYRLLHREAQFRVQELQLLVRQREARIEIDAALLRLGRTAQLLETHPRNPQLRRRYHELQSLVLSLEEELQGCD
jgi:hypothetical protein